MIGSDAINLLFTLSAKNDASPEVKNFRKDVTDLTDAADDASKNSLTDLAQKLGLSAEKTALLGSTLPVAGAAIAGLTTAALATGAALFALAKNTADYGSEIFDASQKTGLSAETLSSLKFAADQSGSSLEAVSGSVSKFSKTVAEAARGSEQAAAKLTRFGIDPQDAINDLDGALGKVFSRIAALPPGVEQMTAAQDAFGKSGADLLPFIRSFDGDMGKLIATAKELGVTLTDEDAAAADQFGDQMDTLQAQIAGVGRTIGRDLLPIFLKLAEDVGDWLKENPDAVKSWATFVKNEVLTVIDLFQKLARLWSVINAPDFEAIKKAYNTPVDSELRAQERQQNANVVRAGGDDKDSFVEFTRRNKKAGDDYVSALESNTKKVKETGASIEKEMRKTFEDLGFHVNRTFGRSINAGSLHPAGKAIDIAHQGKTTDEIVSAIAVGLQKGWQLVDERVKRPGINQTGPHLHFEKDAGKQPSSFLEPKFYGGQAALDYLKKLDADRLNKRTSKDDIADYQKELAKKEEEHNKKIVADREKLYSRILAIAGASAEQEEAIFANMLAKNQITENDFFELRFQSQLRFLEKQQAALEERLQSPLLTEDNRAELEQELAEFRIRLQTKVIEHETEGRERLTEAAEKFAAEVQASLDAEFAASEKVLDLRRQVLATEREILAFRKEQERKVLVNQLDAAKKPEDRLNLIVALEAFDIAESERRRDRAEQDAIEEYRRAGEALTAKEEQFGALEELEKAYFNRIEQAKEEHEARKQEIEREAAEQKQREQFEADTGDGLFGGILGGLGLTIEDMLATVEPLKEIGNIIGAQFNTIASAVGNAVKSFVLFGSAGGSFKKFAAEVLASIAAMAAAQALWEMAQWAAMTALFYFTGNPAYALAAGAHLTAAIIYGSVAAVTAFSGRALAGDSFKKETAGAYGSAGAGAGNGQRSGAPEAGVYSSRDEQVVNLARNSVSDVSTTNININDRSGIFGDFFAIEIERNGRTRDVIKKLANA